MAEKNRFSKPVAFNNKNAEDQKILKHVARRNFSGYVKKLIAADIEAQKQMKSVTSENEQNNKASIYEIAEEKKKLSAAERLAALKQKTEKRPGDHPGPILLNVNGSNKEF